MQDAIQHDDLLTRMVFERERLTRERAGIDRRIRGLDFAIANFQGSPAPDAASVPRSGRRLRNLLSVDDVAAHARRLILAAQRPLTRSELLDLFDRDGLPILAKARAKALGTMLWRARRADGSPLFASTGDGYWPADVERPRTGSPQK